MKNYSFQYRWFLPDRLDLRRSDPAVTNYFRDHPDHGKINPASTLETIDSFKIPTMDKVD